MKKASQFQFTDNMRMGNKSSRRKKKDRQLTTTGSVEKGPKKVGKCSNGIIFNVFLILITIVLTKSFEKIESHFSKNEEIDQKIDNLYSAVILKHGQPKDNKDGLNSSRLNKLKRIQNIQKYAHEKAYANLEKIVPKISEGSSITDWNKVVNAQAQLERQMHKDFSIVEANAFWGKSLNIAKQAEINPMAKTELFSEKPALELAASASNVEINLESLEHKNVQGVILKVKELKYIPNNYPIIPSSDGKTIFVPNVDSLDSLHYFESLKEKTEEKSDLENGVKP